MNKKQRDRLTESRDILEEVITEEEEKLDNMYDFNETERYQKMEEHKDTLEEAKDQIDEVLNS